MSSSVDRLFPANTFNSNKVDVRRNKRICIVDGYNLFMRTFTVVNKFNKRLHHIGALEGCLNTLASLATKYDYLFIAWDGDQSGAWRRQIFPEYKDGRRSKYTYMAGMEDVLTDPNQIDTESILKKHFDYEYKALQEMLNVMPIYNFSLYGLEADDLIAYFCLSEELKDYDIVIFSSDKDFYQLLTPNNRVKIEKKLNEYVTYTSVVNKFGIIPENFALARAIIGDDAGDNIKGIKGYGYKTLIKDFPEIVSMELNLDTFCDHVWERQGKSKKIMSIIENIDNLIAMFKIINLRMIDFKLMQTNQIKFILESGFEYNPLYLKTMVISDDVFDNQGVQRLISNMSKLNIAKKIMI